MTSNRGTYEGATPPSSNFFDDPVEEPSAISDDHIAGVRAALELLDGPPRQRAIRATALRFIMGLEPQSMNELAANLRCGDGTFHKAVKEMRAVLRMKSTSKKASKTE
jgi:hypothetical protein